MASCTGTTIHGILYWDTVKVLVLAARSLVHWLLTVAVVLPNFMSGRLCLKEFSRVDLSNCHTIC
jgi:hypothetical protein